MYKLPTLVIVGTFLLFGCASNVQKKSSTKKTITLKSIKKKKFEWGGSSDNKAAGGLRTIEFMPNSIALSKRAYKLLKKNIAILKDEEDVTIQLEGHCNPISSRKKDFKIAMDRALAVKSYLLRSGIASKRVSLISFGSEKPIVANGDLKRIHKNRRVNFVISYR